MGRGPAHLTRCLYSVTTGDKTRLNLRKPWYGRRLPSLVRGSKKPESVRNFA
jgi:hypothetical protein